MFAAFRYAGLDDFVLNVYLLMLLASFVLSIQSSTLSLFTIQGSPPTIRVVSRNW